MKTGGVLFDVELTDYKAGYSVTVAPLVVKDKVIVGVAGAEYGIRGFIDAYDAQTGKRAWRFYTVAGPGRSRRAVVAARRCLPARRRFDLGDRHLRSRSRTSCSSAPAIPGPDYYSNAREGDNLYTTRSSRSTPIPASGSGTISSRRTTCTTGIRRRCPCSAI